MHSTEDRAHAVLVAAADWLAQIVEFNPDDFRGNSPGKGVSVVIADMDSETPRVEPRASPAPRSGAPASASSLNAACASPERTRARRAGAPRRPLSSPHRSRTSPSHASARSAPRGCALWRDRRSAHSRRSGASGLRRRQSSIRASARCSCSGLSTPAASFQASTRIWRSARIRISPRAPNSRSARFSSIRT
jgi:hypothetical protein